MATPKPKKSGKKPTAKPETVKTVKEVKDTKVSKPAVVATAPSKPMQGFFARKCDADENILTIFKTPKIWGALLGEALGTFFFTMLMLTIGMQQPIYIVIAAACIYAAVVGLSGAHLNPIITAGAMVTRRVSAIRGVLYMLAQLLGAWLGLIILNAFRLGSETIYELPIMTEITGEFFWAVALIELLGACTIAFFFARALKHARKQPLTFALIVTSGIALAAIFGVVISQSFFGLSSSFAFNPVVALMYQILPTTADNIGALLQGAGLAIAAYILFPIVGGIIGFIVSDVVTRLSCGGYLCECDDACCCKTHHE